MDVPSQPEAPHLNGPVAPDAGIRADLPWLLLLAALPFAWIALVLLPPPFGLGLQHGNDFQACRIWWKLMGTVCLQHGFTPLWNHLQDFGSVYPGYTGYNLLYPFSWWLHPFFVPTVPALQSYAEYLGIGLHASFGLVGAFFWLRRHAEAPAPAAALGAALLLINQRFNDFIRYPNGIEVYAWLPWLLLWLGDLLRDDGPADPRPRARKALLLAFGTLMAWLGGYGQYPYIFFMLAGAVMLAHAARPARLAAPLAGFALGCAAAAGTLWPTALHAWTSPERGGGAIHFSSTHPLVIGYGRMFTHPFHADVHASSYFPPAWLPLIVLGLATAWGVRQRRWSLGLVGSAWLIADLSLGHQGLLFEFFHAHVPMYSSFRTQGRNNAITLLALAWFAACGAGWTLQGGARRRLAMAAAMAAAGGLAWWMSHAALEARPASAIVTFGMTDGQVSRAVLALTAISTGALAAFVALRDTRIRFALLALTLAGFVLFFARWTTDYRPRPSWRPAPTYAKGILTPHETGIGTVHSPLLEPLYTPTLRLLDDLGRGEAFPANRFLFRPAAGQETDAPALTLESCGPNHLAARVSSAAPGLLLYIQSWHPGWRANLPLRPVILEGTPLLGIELPSGETRLDLRFRPPDVLLAASVSLAACGWIPAAWFWLGGRRRGAALCALAGAVLPLLFLAGVYARHSWPDAFLFGRDGRTLDPSGTVPLMQNPPPQ